MAGLLDKQRIIASPNYNRWLVPPAALAIHLSIGMAYGFSVFWNPMNQLIGITAPAAGDWPKKQIVWTFTLFFVLLGSSAAIFGQWLERNGPRKAGVVAALCWGGGLLISALGVHLHQLVLVWLGGGVIGGCGLGLGYISPVSTLIKWFPDRRGMATGMAIMGFGGGALIGSPLADRLMNFYSFLSAIKGHSIIWAIQHFSEASKMKDLGPPTSVGVWETLCTMGVIYLVAMLCGAFCYRVPPEGWKPHGWTEPADTKSHLITSGHVHVKQAHKVPQFWMLWLVLCMNVSAGIGVLSMASPMIQGVFAGKLIGIGASPSPLTDLQKAAIASVAAGFVGLLSLSNIAGRIGWASLSDYMGRKRTYLIFFTLGMALYLGAAYAAVTKNTTLFVGLFCVILTMYGGGFATIPAYLADLFGTKYVSAIHGRLLTAWSVAALIGPFLVTYPSDALMRRGVPVDRAYNLSLYVLAALLFIGFVSNLLVRPVDKKHFMSEDELEEEWQMKPEAAANGAAVVVESAKPTSASWVGVAVGWTLVGIPLAWGIFQTVVKASKMF